MTPASASRSRVAAGSASCQETSVVRPRGATSRPRSARAAANVSASVAARSWTASQPASERTSSAARAPAKISRLCRPASWRAASARGTASRPAPGFVEVEVRRAGRGHAVAPLRADPEHPGADRPAEPLLARAGVERAAERARRRPGTAPMPWAPSSSTGTSPRPEQVGRDGAAHPADVRCRDEARLRRRRTRRARAKGTMRTDTSRWARTAASGPVQAGVLLVGDQHLVAAARGRGPRGRGRRPRSWTSSARRRHGAAPSSAA